MPLGIKLILIWISLMLTACSIKPSIEPYGHLSDINLTPQQCLIPRLLIPSSGDFSLEANYILLFGELGQEIRAVAPGEVVFSSWMRGYGKLIIIKHPYGLMSIYAYNDNILVKNAQLVRAGQKIAYMGLNTNGKAALYFALRCHAKSVDPVLYLPNFIP